jgi:hypothetical protein
MCNDFANYFSQPAARGLTRRFRTYRGGVGGFRQRQCTVRARQRCAALAVGFLLTVVAAACTDGDAETGTVVRPAAAISAIAAWQADEQEPVLDAKGAVQLPVIFVVAADGATIDVGIQAEVAKTTADWATLRFADDVADTFDPRLDDSPVRDSGTMLLLGPIPDPAHTITVDVIRYLATDDSEAFRLQITANAAPTGTGDEPGPRASVTAATRL